MLNGLCCENGSGGIYELYLAAFVFKEATSQVLFQLTLEFKIEIENTLCSIYLFLYRFSYDYANESKNIQYAEYVNEVNVVICLRVCLQ